MKFNTRFGTFRFVNTYRSMYSSCWDITIMHFWYESWGYSEKGNFAWECDFKVLGFKIHYDSPGLVEQEQEYNDFAEGMVKNVR